MKQTDELYGNPGASCGCGEAALEISGRPLFRCYCHCTICQRFNDADFADVTVFRAADVKLVAPSQIAFETLRPPPNVQRGRCRSCGMPAVEQAAVPLLAKITIVPTATLASELRPEPAMHIFYRHRVVDCGDALPRHDGYIGSQFAFARRLMRALSQRKR
jgi:hypothetical protein